MGRVKLQVSLLTSTKEAELTVALAAKLCYANLDNNSLKTSLAEKEQGVFIDRLVEMGHLSPIEHASFTFLVEGVSRSLLAQVTRHRIASFSVRSQRYVNHSSHNDSSFSYIIPPQIEALGVEAIEKFTSQMQQIQGWYDDWILQLGNKGESSNEDARFVLPNAAETKFVLTMNARELQHFFKMRCCNRAQWEIRNLATEMLWAVRQEAGCLFAKSGPGCIAGSCPEGKMSCGRQKEMQNIFGK